MPNPLRPSQSLLPLAVVLLLTSGSARADTIIFKDGFALQGKVIREKKTIIDPANGQPIELNEGFFMVYDGARIVLFSPSHLDRAVDDKDFAPERGELKWDKRFTWTNTRAMPPVFQITDVGEFDKEWNRSFKFLSTGLQAYSINQHLGSISPFYARVDTALNVKVSPNYIGSACYLTRELGPAVVRGLIVEHPDVKDDPMLEPEKRVNRKLKVAQFLAQAGWIDHAGEELVKLTKNFPDQKEAIETAQAGFQKMRNIQSALDVKNAYRAGNFQKFEDLVGKLNEDGVPKQTLDDVWRMKDDFKTAKESLKLADRFLSELPKEVQPQLRDLFTEAAAAIRSELTPDTITRLKSFLSQAMQAERQKKEGQTPTLAPVNLLALALSGWVLDDFSAESKPDAAQKLWQTRQMVLKYQSTHDGPTRRDVLNKYVNDKSGAVAIDEMAQIISLLPPPEPEPKFEGKTKEFKAGRNGRGPTYLVQLPREYSHGRPWPVLMVLHAGGETPQDMYKRWSEQAEAHGYILAVPDWNPGVQGTYNYTPEEHKGVTETLLDLRRRFNVDSDRVFLFGLGSGGNMAFDVGLSHPDLFAGVLPMSSLPGGFCYRYRFNAQHLPFYIVNGDNLPQNTLRKYFEEWVPLGYPMLYSQYIGRGVEWFPGEVDLAFDWMDRKERANPVAQLGRKELTTVRPADNRFYWLGTDRIKANQLNEQGKFNGNVVGAQLLGLIGKNQITLRVAGVNQVSVWLGRDRRGQNMIEFDKEVTVYINDAVRMKAKVTPSMKLMLEELYDRGDKQRLDLARLDFEVR